MKRLLIIGTLLAFAGINYGWYLYQKPAEGVRGRKAEKFYPAAELSRLLAEDKAAPGRLAGQVILVEGVLTSVDRAEVTAFMLDGSIRGELSRPDQLPQPGSKVKIKGMLGGYDELFGETVLVKCQIESGDEQ